MSTIKSPGSPGSTPLTVELAQNEKVALLPVSFAHLRINVVDKNATARWYVENMDLEIVASGNPDLVHVADRDHNFMFEFSSIPDIRNTYFDIHVDGFHVAFEGHKSIEQVAEKMLAKGARQEGSIYRNAIGDYVLNARDPNGLAIQLIHRVNPFYAKPAKSAIRFEHFGYNTPAHAIAALWYVEFMDLLIPWSKDIDEKANRLRNYRVPYVGDAARKMTFELYDKAGIDYSFSKVGHEECHMAFSVNDPEKLAERMIYGGARKLSAMRTESNGDRTIDLVDPRDFPVRLIKRI